jgi:predicted DNA-binding transcriptional regulator YafY
MELLVFGFLIYLLVSFVSWISSFFSSSNSYSSKSSNTLIVIGTIKQAISERKSLKIEYRKYDGTKTSRIISKISYNNEFSDDGYYNDHIKAYCHLRNEDRTFRISRITSAYFV